RSAPPAPQMTSFPRVPTRRSLAGVPTRRTPPRLGVPGQRGGAGGGGGAEATAVVADAELFAAAESRTLAVTCAVHRPAGAIVVPAAAATASSTVTLPEAPGLSAPTAQ